MKFNQPCHPILIVGAGIAGLAAGYALRELDVPYRILERFPRAGGRLNSREGKGWIADHGAPFILRSDTILQDLVRYVGMEQQRVVIQGGVHLLHPDNRIEVPASGGIDPNRQCIEQGFAELCRRMGTQLGVLTETAVGAVRWDDDEKTFWWQKEGQVFWLEDERGEPILDPDFHKPMIGSGLILATTGTAARRICERSGSLQAVAERLQAVTYNSTFTGIFRVPKVDFPWFALDSAGHPRLLMVSLEDRKAPGRTAPGTSMIVVHCTADWSAELMQGDPHDALREVYAELRRVVRPLPEEPVSQTFKKWHASRPTSPPLGFPASQENPRGRWPTNPPHVPFALAGEYLLGRRAEDAARSGLLAAQSVLSQLPRVRRFLGVQAAPEYPVP